MIKLFCSGPPFPAYVARVFPRRLLILILLGALLAALAARADVTPADPTATLQTGGAAVNVDLRPFFREPAARGSVVKVNVRIGTVTTPVYLGLNDQTQPLTTANFVRYVNDGKFNGSFFHRLVRNFVLQGGGFYFNTAGQVAAIATYPAVQNEPGISNVRGTIAMAKLGGDPNSATSQWFVNLADNSANLDFQNGGFTVFGSVLRNGMNIIDQAAALPIYDASTVNAALSAVPLSDGSTTVGASAVMVPPFAPGAVSGDASLVAATVTGSNLRLAPGTNPGTTTVSLSAADLDGSALQATVTVNVALRSAGWHRVNDASGLAAAFTFDPTDSTGLVGDLAGAPGARWT